MPFAARKVQILEHRLAVGSRPPSSHRSARSVVGLAQSSAGSSQAQCASATPDRVFDCKEHRSHTSRAIATVGSIRQTRDRTATVADSSLELPATCYATPQTDDFDATVDGARRDDARPAPQHEPTTMQHREHPEAVQTCTRVLPPGPPAERQWGTAELTLPALTPRPSRGPMPSSWMMTPRRAAMNADVAAGSGGSPNVAM